jgi:hypothetical protein
MVHVAVGWMVVLGAGYASQIGCLRRLPFSAPAARGETFGPIAPLAAAVSGTALFLGVVHYLALEWIPGLVAYVLGLAVLVLVLRWTARQVMLRRFAVEVSRE